MTDTPDSADSAPEQSTETPEQSTKKRSALREGVILVSIALVLYYVMLTFVARPYLIPSESMEPTLHGCAGCVGDRIMVDKVTYRFTSPEPGDVIVFKGAVIRRSGGGIRETFTVRKESYGVGVERTFPVHSPNIDHIEVVTRGDVRRAKLYYLRELRGKKAKIKEKR